VENHSNGQNEYALTGLQVAQVRAVLQSWRDGSGQSRGVGSGTL
jgi:hypothetical protein